MPYPSPLAPRAATVAIALAGLLASGCVEAAAVGHCDEGAACGPCGRCVEGTCQSDSAALAQSTCVATAPDPCDGEDNDGNGIIDDPPGCWAEVWEFSGPDGVRCFGVDQRHPPGTCRGYWPFAEAPAFWLASLPVPGTVPLVQCSRGADHVLVSVGGLGWDVSADAWEALGYDCGLTLGYAWVDAAPFSPGAGFERGAPCALTRWVSAPEPGGEPPLGRHAVALGGRAAPPGFACAAGLGATVVASSPACGATGPAECAVPTCGPVVRGEVVARALDDDALVSPGAALTQVWTVRNTGEARWSAGWTFTPLTAGSRAVGPAAVPLRADVAPGEEATLTVAFTAADAGVDVSEAWALREEVGGAALVALPFRYDVAAEVVAEVPWVLPAARDAWSPEFYSRFRLRLVNPTDVSWGPDFRLVRELGTASRVAELKIPSLVYAHGQIELDIPAISPATPGVYPERWRFESPGGDRIPINGAATLDFVLSVRGDSMAVVTGETVPDGARIPPGTPFVKSWRLRSVAGGGWREGAILRHVDGGLALVEEVAVPGPWEAGAEVEVAVPLRVPTGGAGATYTDRWELVGGDGELVTIVDRDDVAATLRPLNGPGWLWSTVVAEVPCGPARRTDAPRSSL